MKNLKLFALITYLLFLPNMVQPYEAGIEYDEVYIDYQKLNYDEWKHKADTYLEQARNSKTEEEKKTNYSKAAGAYHTIINVYSGDAVVMATLGHIYGKMNKPAHAKSFLDRGLNLDMRSPIVNYYYGVFREDQRDYRKALKFYNNAYNYGMANDGELNMRLAIVNAKLGEIDKSIFHYNKACELLKDKNLSKKIQELNKLQK